MLYTYTKVSPFGELAMYINKTIKISLLIIYLLAFPISIFASQEAVMSHKALIDKFVKSYKQSYDSLELKDNIYSLKCLDCKTLLNLVQDNNIHYQARYYLIELFKEYRCPDLKQVLNLMESVDNWFLKNKIAETLGDIGESEHDQANLKQSIGKYKTERQSLWTKAQTYPETKGWIEEIEKFPMWSYGQKKMISGRRISGPESVSSLYSDIVNNYLVLFNLYDSLWRLEAKIEKRNFDRADDINKGKYIDENLSNRNRYVKYFILEYLMGKKEFKKIKEMWNPDDIFFSIMYLNVVSEYKATELIVFLFDSLGKLFEQYGLCGKIPLEFLNPDASHFFNGWQVAVLALNLEQHIDNIGDIRLIIIEYLEAYPNYQGKTLLLSLLNRQLLEVRVQSAVRDAVDQRALTLIKKLQSNKLENLPVSQKAQEMLKNLYTDPQ